ncbi:unconventional myosin-Vb-like isoform X2 [Alligator sinensis]|uniref:Unconventional myosin-Vb-like isoform X2 n=1 Tax=Alligator sinensis TaxID=38654 RepID=A0A3Q0H151_ALLSI|nr:unconventional myosin-Vb-like isoform X2 [Alligator sinensis]
MAAPDLYAQGAQVWIPDCVEVWKPAEVTRGYKEGDGVLYLRLEDGQEVAYPLDPCCPQLPHLRNPDYLSGENNLVALSYLHEPAVLHTLRTRFLESSTIYTYCGIVLVAVNPYKQLPIYEEAVIHAYSGQNIGEMDPHIFAVAEEAYRQMSREDKNQSLIISGESGAGKTATAKYAMRYFAIVGGSLSNSSVEEKVLASSPIMEAFGNAKTTRNDNSSRFGKYVEICFNHEYRVLGATMKTYLLEKSRVTFQATVERNYHIFYQLCASASLPELQGLGLGGPESFHYTNQGQCMRIGGTDDAADLDRTRNAFSLLGVSEADQLELFSILAAILHLGNIRLKKKSRHGESCFIEPEDKALELFCMLLGLETSQVSRWLCYHKLVTASETFVKPMSWQQVLDSRDALAKHIYGQLFQWVVSRINRSLRASERHRASIGILDIYGFETFRVNSFEQFCINYANEKLQQHFNLHVFKLEQEEYVEEGIPWTFIDFYDNQPCIDLIEAKLGILDLLNEECKMPNGSDGSWAQKLYDRHLHHSLHFEKPKMHADAFIIQHFAGKVEYQCKGFLEKNRDAVHAELIGLLRASKSQLLAELFPEDCDGTISLRRSNGTRLTVRPSRKSLPGTNKEHRKPISIQFKASLHKLMEMLGCTTPHYIRCIKPNDLKRPFEFDSKRAIEQLRACGILETIQISASGYPSRWTYEDFFSRYRVLMSRVELTGDDEKKICRLVLERLLRDPSKYQCGRRKVFLRAGQVAFLEELRAKTLRAACIVLQSSLRGWLGRRRFLLVRAAAIHIQRFARGLLARRLVRDLRRAKAAVILQKNIKMALARRSYLRIHVAIITIQAFTRGMFARHLYRVMVLHQKAMVIQAAVRGWLARSHYARLRRAAVYLQCCFRRSRARRELKQLRIEARSVEHYKQLHKGMEIKVMQLQCKLDEQARENRSLLEQLSVLSTSHAEEVERLCGEMQQLREDKAQDQHIQGLQEQLQCMELEKRSSERRLCQELEQLKQRMTELEAAKSNLKDENDTLNRRLLEQSKDVEEKMCQRLSVESRELQCELEEERSRYQSLVKEYARLEQGYENLREEVAFHKHTTGFRRSPSSDSILDSESSYQSGSTALSRDEPIQQIESPSQPLNQEKDPWRLIPEQYRARSDSTTSSLSSDGEQDPLKAYILLGQLNAVRKELARTQEELHKTKTQLAHEDKKLLRPWYIAELFGLNRSPEKMMEEDLKHAYDAVQVTNRLLEEQLQEQQQQHKQEREGLHQDIRSLKRLTWQQQSLIQDLQHQQSGDGLQRQIVQLKEENLELSEQLQRQERSKLKLQKQLKNYMKQIQEPAATREATRGERATPAEQERPLEVPSPSGPFQGMLRCRGEDEERLVRTIITDFQPQHIPGTLPTLPGYILFMCLRHADYCQDEHRIRSLLTAAINGIKRVMKKHSEDFDMVTFWLANTCCLLNCLRQYGRDESYRQVNTPKQNLHCLQHCNPVSHCQSLGDLAIQIYQQLIGTAEKKLKPMIVAAMLESETIPGLSSTRPSGSRRPQGAPAYTLDSLLLQLSAFHKVLKSHDLEPAIVQQAVRQLLFLISGTALNYLLLRRDACSWSQGVQLRYNVSQLEEWLRAGGLQQSGATTILEPLIQAAQLLQVKKTSEEDAEAICCLCTTLSPQQVVKLLRAYTPAPGLEERVSPHFISSVEKRLAEQNPSGPCQLLVDTAQLFPVPLPFSHSPVHLDEICLPDGLNLTFLSHM